MVVILPSFTIALFRGKPFLYPTRQPPLPSFFSSRSEGSKLTSSQTRVGDIVYSEGRDATKSNTMKIILNVMQKKLILLGSKHTHYADKV